MGFHWLEGLVISIYMQFSNLKFYVMGYGYEILSVSRMGTWYMS